MAETYDVRNPSAYSISYLAALELDGSARNRAGQRRDFVERLAELLQKSGERIIEDLSNPYDTMLDPWTLDILADPVGNYAGKTFRNFGELREATMRVADALCNYKNASPDELKKLKDFCLELSRNTRRAHRDFRGQRLTA